MDKALHEKRINSLCAIFWKLAKSQAKSITNNGCAKYILMCRYENIENRIVIRTGRLPHLSRTSNKNCRKITKHRPTAIRHSTLKKPLESHKHKNKSKQKTLIPRSSSWANVSVVFVIAEKDLWFVKPWGITSSVMLKWAKRTMYKMQKKKKTIQHWN